MPPPTASSTTAASATTVSMSCPMPSQRASGAPASQPSTVSTKTSTTHPRCGVQGCISRATTMRACRRGRSSKASTPSISGHSTATSGSASANHWAKPMPACAPASALGGLPISVPMPPMLAL